MKGSLILNWCSTLFDKAPVCIEDVHSMSAKLLEMQRLARDKPVMRKQLQWVLVSDKFRKGKRRGAGLCWFPSAVKTSLGYRWQEWCCQLIWIPRRIEVKHSTSLFSMCTGQKHWMKKLKSKGACFWNRAIRKRKITDLLKAKQDNRTEPNIAQ